MITKKIGKIQDLEFGFGGYQDAQIGITFTLGNDGWGVGYFRGPWSIDPDEYCKWTKEEQIKEAGETVMYIRNLLRDAKVSNINKLINKPIEVTFDGNLLKEWRILTEAI